MTTPAPDKFYWESPVKTNRNGWLRKQMIVLYAIFVVLLGIGISGYHVIYAQPVIAVDYRQKMEELTRRLQGMPADAENGWLVLDGLVPRLQQANDKVCAAADWRVTNAYINVMTLYDPSTKLEGRGETWDQVQSTSLEFLHELQNSGVFAAAEHLRTVKFALRPQTTPKLLDFLIPEAGTARYLTRSNVARMYLARQRGDETERLAAFEQCMGLSRIESRQPSCIEYLVGVAIMAAAIGEVRREFIEKTADEATCARWIAAMNAVEAPSPEAAFEGERVLDLDAMQGVSRIRGDGSGRLLLTELNKIAVGPNPPVPPTGLGQWFHYRVSNLGGLFLPGRQETLAQLNTYFNGLVNQTRMSRTQRLADSFDAKSFEGGLPKSYMFLQIMLPAGGKVLQSYDQIRLDVAGTRLMLEIEMHRAKTGNYPRMLDELRAEAQGGVAADPFSGKAFGYKLLRPGEDADGRSYLLYSFGADGEDNGGAAGSSTFMALQPGKGVGTDFVINLPRPRAKQVEPAKEP